jgi:ABC-2 type transport system ATP-binding protein
MAADDADAFSGAFAIDLVDVSRRFGGAEVVRGLTFGVRRGTICGLLAPSGGGKTTTLRLIAGIYPPSSGTVRVLGSEPSRFGEDDRRRIGYMPQHFVLYPELTVRRNLQFMAGVYGLPRRGRSERVNELITLVDLEDARDRSARRLSGGMQRRLQLAATLLHDPTLLIIDEPTAGIDPLLRARFWEHFRDLRDEGRTLVISTQYVTEAEHCDQIVLMRAGEVVAAGTPDELRARAFGPAAADRSRSFEDVFVRLMGQFAAEVKR